MLNRKVVSLEVYMEARLNEVHQDTTSTLQELKETVAVVRESQEKVRRAIDGMSKEVQEMVQEDACADGGEDTKPMLASVNLAEEEPVPTTESSIDAQPYPEAMGPIPHVFHLSRRRSVQC